MASPVQALHCTETALADLIIHCILKCIDSSGIAPHKKGVRSFSIGFNTKVYQYFQYCATYIDISTIALYAGMHRQFQYCAAYRKA